MNRLIITMLVIVFGFCVPQVKAKDMYEYAWPGILPDQKILYAIKTVRNKLIERMLITPAKRIEFYLLMADKTLYAATLLYDRGETELGRQTALKGENYFSMLVSEYAKTSGVIPAVLEEKIDNAFVGHMHIITSLQKVALPGDKKVFDDIGYFAVTNYSLIQDIRRNNK